MQILRHFNPKKIDYKLKPWIKRDYLNVDVHKILRSFHYKTHFKTAKEVAANKSITQENKNDKDSNDINLNQNNNILNNIKSINKSIEKNFVCFYLIYSRTKSI